MLRLLLLFICVTYASAITCSELRTTYNDKLCCQDSGVDTCLRILPSCADASVVAGQICTDIQGRAFVKGLSDAFDLGNSNQITFKKHMIPDTNSQYDLGNAEYKVRYLFETD